MTSISFQGTTIELEPDETMLDALLRSGIDTPYSCKSGVCETCMLQANLDGIDATADWMIEAQKTLKPTLRQLGYVLACVCRPTQDLDLVGDGVDTYVQNLKVLDKHCYNDSVARIRIERPKDFNYRSGQFINLRWPGRSSLIRSYSLASHPAEDEALEIHVRRKAGGAFSCLLLDELQLGDRVDIQGPHGECFYTTEADRDMLLIGTGTGISPLVGILREAMTSGHTGRIDIFYGSHNHSGLYLGKELRSLVGDRSQVRLTLSLSGEDHESVAPGESIEVGRASDLALERVSNLGGRDIYLCGNPGMVRSAQQRVYLAGASLQRIFADPFEYQNLRRKR